MFKDLPEGQTHFVCKEILERDSGSAQCCCCSGHICKKEQNDGREFEHSDWRKMKEDLREEFETLFEKDQEAIDGIRPSKSNRSAALVLWGRWEMILQAALDEKKI